MTLKTLWSRVSFGVQILWNISLLSLLTDLMCPFGIKVFIFSLLNKYTNKSYWPQTFMVNIQIWTCLYTNVPRSNWSELFPQVCLTSSLSHPKGYRAHPDPISSPAERQYTLWIQTDLKVNKKNFITRLRAPIISRCVRRRAWYLLKNRW